MGAWDYGPFGNDGAYDALGFLADGPAGELAERLRAVLDRGRDEDYLENPEAQGAMAAAVVVAAKLGAAVDDANAVKFLAGNDVEVTAELREHALRTYMRVTAPGDNEWHALWEESGSLQRVLALHEPFRAVLAG